MLKVFRNVCIVVKGCCYRTRTVPIPADTAPVTDPETVPVPVTITDHGLHGLQYCLRIK